MELGDVVVSLYRALGVNGKRASTSTDTKSAWTRLE
jgi:hypothetical protein